MAKNSKEMARNFGEVLESLCLERNLSARKLARELNHPYKTVNEWIGQGARMPRDPTTLRHIANYFKVSTHFLLFGEEDPRNIISEILEKTDLHTGLYEITVRKVKTRKNGGASGPNGEE